MKRCIVTQTQTTPIHNSHQLDVNQIYFFLLGRGKSEINEAISRVKGTFQFGKQIYLHKLFFRHLLKKNPINEILFNQSQILSRRCPLWTHEKKTHAHTRQRSLCCSNVNWGDLFKYDAVCKHSRFFIDKYTHTTIRYNSVEALRGSPLDLLKYSHLINRTTIKLNVIFLLTKKTFLICSPATKSKQRVGNIGRYDKWQINETETIKIE